jgi:GT2 family glycosyltransferase
LVKNKISIVIVTHNSAPIIKGCLVSLHKALRGIDAELVVVDNGSNDDSCEQIKQQFPDANIIVNKRNRGFAAACNQAVKEAEGEFVLFLNPDVRLDFGCLDSLRSAIQEDDKAGAVVPRMRYPDDSFQATCRRFPTMYNMLFSRGSVLTKLFGGSHIYTLGDYPETTIVDATAATVLMIRLSLLVRIGGFDERFFLYMEDTDLCLRLKSLGYRNYFVPSAGGVHDWGQGSNAGGIARACRHHLSVWRYFLKHSPNGFSLLVLPMILIMNLALVIASIPFRRRRER